MTKDQRTMLAFAEVFYHCIGRMIQDPSCECTCPCVTNLKENIPEVINKINEVRELDNE